MRMIDIKAELERVYAIYEEIIIIKDTRIQELEQIISYLPKVPTQPYEKEMAQRILELESWLREIIGLQIKTCGDLEGNSLWVITLREANKALAGANNGGADE